MVIPKAIECKKLEVIVPESEVDNTQKLASIEKTSKHRKRSSPTSSKSEVEEEYEGSTKIYEGHEYCYRHQRNWAKKRKLNISMWPKPNIYSCHGIYINFLLTKDEIEEDLSLIRKGIPPVNS
ncbi:hypothetical protein HHI36_009755 [Cryptolaemus montrouzieri]|uniref:Uncharacterized protein n=1 Tax=Cryptolaemus montrouzieri TaxID=559131 RepID=A0ABD2MGR1_9CUCU